jgi:replicative DNA helicase
MRYTTASEDNSRLVTEAATTEFGSCVTRYAGVGKWHQLLISGNGNRWHPAGVNAWLRELGIFGQRSHQKRLPRAAFRLSNRQIALLLGHLWATDGCISVRANGSRGGHGVFFSTCSAGLAGDVRALLLRLGIVSREYRIEQGAHRPLFSVDVSGTLAQMQFLDTVGAFGPRVQPAQALREALASVKANTNVDTVPREVFDQVRSRMREQGITQREMARLRGTSYGGTAHFKFSPSRGVLTGYAALLGDEELLELARNEIFWDTVVSVTPRGEDEVFDLTVPSTANWLADGVVSHNSGALEQDADIVIMLWRDREETPPGAPRLINGSIAKNRNGPTGIFQLLFESEQARFFSKAQDDGGPPV